MRNPGVALVAAAALVASFALPAGAGADTTSLYHPTDVSRNFSNSIGGWTQSESYSGLCVVGVTCADITNSFQGVNGADGALDGHLRTSEAGLLSVGILATSSGILESPQFTYDGAGGAVPDELDFTISRRANVATLLALPDAGVTYSAALIDHSGGADQTLAAAEPVAQAGSFNALPPVDIPPAALTIGHSYSIRITTSFNAPAAVVPAANVDYDNVVLRALEDTTAPDTTIDGGPTGPTNDSTPTFTYGSADPQAEFECAIDAGSFSSCPVSGFTATTLSDGPHTFTVRAIDPADNVDATPAQRSFSVDTVDPSTTLDQVPSDPGNDPTPTFGFSSNDPNAHFECSIDGAGFSDCSPPFTAPAMTDGSHTFAVRAVDQAGNTDPAPKQASFEVDTQAPTTTIDGGPTGTTDDATPQFSFSSTDTSATFQCSVDGAAFTACSSPVTLAALANGSHTFAVRAVDPAGNIDPSASLASFTVAAENGGPVPTPPGSDPTSPGGGDGPIDPGNGAILKGNKLYLNVRCAKKFRPDRCRIKTQVLTKKKHGKKASKSASRKVKAGKRKLVVLKLKPKFAASLVAMKKVVVRQRIAAGERDPQTRHRRLRLRVLTR